MFRYTIREALLVLVIVGLAVGWWIDRRRQAGELKWANAEIGNLRKSNETILAGPDWTLYDRLVREAWDRSEVIRKRERVLRTNEGQR